VNYNIRCLIMIFISTPLLAWGIEDKPPVPFRDGSGAIIGEAKLVDSKQGVKVSLDLKGMKPGTYAMHIHENGKCEGPKFESAGSHLNPNGKEHGLHNPKGAHLGDLPNITIPTTGNLSQNITIKKVTLKKGAANSLQRPQGTSFVIHAKPDDGMTDPSGNAGDRLYCAVIFEPQPMNN
jgi:superoxide dismutase, Cu-Zn family